VNFIVAFKYKGMCSLSRWIFPSVLLIYEQCEFEELFNIPEFNSPIFFKKKNNNYLYGSWEESMK
jgi:hypothetical protein